ncbi:AAA family ATPase [Paramuribaculum intestinale]|uniref:AAA family ATPase n=2 Tax=Paramuribaculum intestinale TaxID=2094151 RepID=UPI002740FB45|nr:AAA family ATPase [Paramuribaculum intestinale]WLT41579.1 AAA family ATPase [Paramuribaculum intestinale]
MSRQVTLKRLTLVNFKGLRNVAVEFGDGVTTISGRNGTGKTTIADSFAWLLWGKDSEGNSDSKFGIKTNDAEGNFIPDLEHEVTGLFDVVDTETGEASSVELRRVYVEEWKTPKGSTERTLSGHHTDYFFNGVPLKKAEYDAKVATIIPEDLFKVITDPYYFLTLHWKAQREYLLTMAGKINDADVAATREEFAALLRRVTGKTMEEYKKEISVRRGRIEAQLEKIPTRKDEATRNTPVAPNYAALESEKAQIQEDLANIDAAAASEAEANRVAYEQAAKIQAEINTKRDTQAKALQDAKEAARAAAYETNRVADEAARDLAQVQRDEESENKYYSREKSVITASIATAKRRKEDYEAQVADLRKNWEKVNNEQFQEQQAPTAGPLICPVFGHQCADPGAPNRHQCDAAAALESFRKNQDTARAAFIANQTARLDKMDAEGQELNRLIAAQDAEIKRLEAEAVALDTKHNAAVQDYATKKATYNNTIAANPRVSTDPQIDPQTLPTWVALQKEIDQLNARRAAVTAPTTQDTAAERQQSRATLRARLSEIDQKLGLRATIKAAEARIVELDKEAATLAQEKATLQTEEALIDDFVRCRMEEVERRVNGLFDGVEFRMYKTLVNGEKEPDCVAYIGGVRYQDKNHAGQINAGLAVINALCAFHGVTAPIIVDNAESVNDFIPVKSQLVRLVVTTGEFQVTNN